MAQPHSAPSHIAAVANALRRRASRPRSGDRARTHDATLEGRQQGGHECRHDGRPGQGRRRANSRMWRGPPCRKLCVARNRLQFLRAAETPGPENPEEWAGAASGSTGVATNRPAANIAFIDRRQTMAGTETFYEVIRRQGIVDAAS